MIRKYGITLSQY